MSRPETVAWRRGHLDWSANILAVFHDTIARAETDARADGTDATGWVTIKNDETGEVAMKLRPYGAALMVQALRAHRCGPACDKAYGICPMIAIAWLIEGCPQPGDDLALTAMRGMSDAASGGAE